MRANRRVICGFPPRDKNAGGCVCGDTLQKPVLRACGGGEVPVEVVVACRAHCAVAIGGDTMDPLRGFADFAVADGADRVDLCPKQRGISILRE